MMFLHGYFLLPNMSEKIACKKVAKHIFLIAINIIFKVLYNSKNIF